MRNILKSALALLLTLAIAASFTACGPDNSLDGSQSDSASTGDSQPVQQEQATVPADASQTVSSQPEVTAAPESEAPAVTTPETSETEDTTTEETTAATTTTEKTTEKTTVKTTEKTTEKTTKKTEKTTEKTTKETEPEEGSRLPDDENDEEIDLDWEEIDMDEWLEIIGASGEEIPEIDVNE